MSIRKSLGFMSILLLGAGLASVASAGQPTVVYETTIGGYFLPRGTEVTVDAAGNAYAIGSFYADQIHLDVVVVKSDPDGGVLWTKFVVGDSHDYATDLALDPQGNVWVVGWTDSGDFPITPDAYRTSGTHREVFLMELSPADGSILYSTFLGGDHTDEGRGIAINAAGEIYVVGSTKSTDFPTTVDAYQGEPSAPLYVYKDAFISKFAPGGRELLYSTYFGGYTNDEAEHVALDAGGNIVFAGETDADDFPLVHPIQSDPHSIFVAELSADGSDLLFGTYLGGEGFDRLFDMEMDATGAVYLTGSTQSISFPTTSGAFQEDLVGEINGCGDPPFIPTFNCDDGYVTKLRTDGSGLVFSTFLGGTSIEECHGIAVNDDGTVYVTGQTTSADFPGTENDGLYFVSKLSADGGALVYTFRRYSSNSGGLDITTDASGGVYTTGGANYPAELYLAKLTDGDGGVVGVPGAGDLESGLRLETVRPNPFRSATSLSYVLPGEGRTQLAIFNLAGQRVRVLVDQNQDAGEHFATWDGSDTSGSRLPGGMYFYQLLWNGQRRTGRTLLLR